MTGGSDGTQVTVIKPAGLDLPGHRGELVGPFAAAGQAPVGGRHGALDGHQPLDHFDGGLAGGGGAVLFPGPCRHVSSTISGSGRGPGAAHLKNDRAGSSRCAWEGNDRGSPLVLR